MRDFLISFLWRFRMGNKERRMFYVETERKGLNIFIKRRETRCRFLSLSLLVGSSSSQEPRLTREKEDRKTKESREQEQRKRIGGGGERRRIGNEVGGDSIRWINATRENDDVDVFWPSFQKRVKGAVGSWRIHPTSFFSHFVLFFFSRLLLTTASTTFVTFSSLLIMKSEAPLLYPSAALLIILMHI